MLSCNMQKGAGEGVRDNVEVPGNVEYAEINVLLKKDAAREKQDGIVSPGRLEGVEDLDGVQTVSVNRKTPGNRVEGSGVFDGRGDTKCLKPENGEVGGT
jgi:hypothetical protein